MRFFCTERERALSTLQPLNPLTLIPVFHSYSLYTPFTLSSLVHFYSLCTIYSTFNPFHSLLFFFSQFRHPLYTPSNPLTPIPLSSITFLFSTLHLLRTLNFVLLSSIPFLSSTVHSIYSTHSLYFLFPFLS